MGPSAGLLAWRLAHDVVQLVIGSAWDHGRHCLWNGHSNIPGAANDQAEALLIQRVGKEARMNMNFRIEAMSCLLERGDFHSPALPWAIRIANAARAIQAARLLGRTEFSNWKHDVK